MLMKKSVIIVGAGIAGLSTGIYLLQSGFDVTILEQHSITGGFCTSWKRKGYTFEGAVHWLTGSNKNIPLYKLWEETGAISKDVKLYYHDPFAAYDYNGQQICLYRDVDKLKAHLLEISPEDASTIERLCKDIKLFFGMKMPIMDQKGVKTKKKSRITLSQIYAMLPAIFNMRRFTRLSVEEYASAFKHPGIRALLTDCVVPKEFGSMSLLVTLATFAKDGAFPEGGSLGIVKRMTDKYISLGGKLQLKTKVENILVENNKAYGVVANGNITKADAVVVTQDTLSAVDKLFSTPPADHWVEEMKQNTKPQICTFVSIGVRSDLSDLPHLMAFPLDKPIISGGKEYNTLGFTNYAAHKEYSPEGCTALTIALLGDTYDYWVKSKANGCYEKDKKEVADQIVNALVSKLPRLENTVEVMDVATPLTYERYTGSYKGSWMSIMQKGDKMSSYPCKCADIDNVFFAGQRTQPPGGLPVAVYSGRKAAQLLCRENDMVFQELANVSEG
jgi:phytoene dehydrogenase-like protein